MRTFWGFDAGRFRLLIGVCRTSRFRPPGRPPFFGKRSKEGGKKELSLPPRPRSAALRVHCAQGPVGGQDAPMPQEAMDGRSGLGNFFAALGKEVTRPGGRNKRPPRTPKRRFTRPVNPATPLAEKTSATRRKQSQVGCQAQQSAPRGLALGFAALSANLRCAVGHGAQSRCPLCALCRLNPPGFVPTGNSDRAKKTRP